MQQCRDPTIAVAAIFGCKSDNGSGGKVDHAVRGTPRPSAAGGAGSPACTSEARKLDTAPDGPAYLAGAMVAPLETIKDHAAAAASTDHWAICIGWSYQTIVETFPLFYFGKLGESMTLSLTAVDHDDLCHGWTWQIEDEDQLVEDVARIALGQYRHISRILSGLSTRPATTTAEHITDAIAKLAPDANGATWRRDGWLFQAISWIAAHHNKGSAIIRAPHIRKADHGFDGLQLDLSDDGLSISGYAAHG